MKKVGFFLITILFISACFSKYEFWPMEKFHLDDQALSEFEEVKLIYTSRAPDDDRNRDYYIHMIAVSEQSGDTVNILTRLDHEFEVEDAYKTFIFLSGEHSVSSLLLSGPNEPGKHKEIKADQKEIHKVARDPDFDELADNDHPTIIGFVGERIDELPKELKE